MRQATYRAIRQGLMQAKSVLLEPWYRFVLTVPTEAVGSLTFTAKGPPGDVVVIRCGEELNSDGSVRFDMRCNCRYEEQMILSGGVDVMDHYDYRCNISIRLV